MNDPPRPNRRELARIEEERSDLMRAIAGALAELRGVLLGIGAVLERIGNVQRDRAQSSHDLAVDVVDEIAERTGSHNLPSTRPPFLRWLDYTSRPYVRKAIAVTIMAAATASAGWLARECATHTQQPSQQPKGTP